MDEEVEIRLDQVTLGGVLGHEGEGGLVVFAHGSGSSRYSPRNRYVASALRDAGLATLLMDLLTPSEDADPSARFDVETVSRRLSGATEWARSRLGDETSVGYFGSSTGAAAALIAASEDARVRALVSRGGRVDMASDVLHLVECPTLLVVGEEDAAVLEFNRRAYDALECEKELFVVEDAGHLFEGPRQLEQVARRAADWFVEHLR